MFTMCMFSFQIYLVFLFVVHVNLPEESLFVCLLVCLNMSYLIRDDWSAGTINLSVQKQTQVIWSDEYSLEAEKVDFCPF